MKIQVAEVVVVCGKLNLLLALRSTVLGFHPQHLEHFFKRQQEVIVCVVGLRGSAIGCIPLRAKSPTIEDVFGDIEDLERDLDSRVGGSYDSSGKDGELIY